MTPSETYKKNLHIWSDIQDHLPLLRSEAKGNVMEIGVRSGMSTSALLSGVEEKGGHLYSVDIANCRPFPDHPKWTFIQADSIHHAEHLKTVIPDELELLFVDGDHTYDGCLADLNNFGARAKKILVHDCEALNFPGVKFACHKYANQNKRTFQILPGSYGMGVIE